ncbi:GNAT family N-acetyltransferase [Arthrobacter sp. HLT1-21]
MSLLGGEGVLLRPWRAQDVDFAYDLYSNEDVQRFLGRIPKVVRSRASAETLIHRLSAVKDPVTGYWVVGDASSAELPGTVMLQSIRLSGTDGPSDEVEIGWHFIHGRGPAATRPERRRRFATLGTRPTRRCDGMLGARNSTWRRVALRSVPL